MAAHRYNRYDDIEINVETIPRGSSMELRDSLDRELSPWLKQVSKHGSLGQKAIVWVRVPVRESFVIPWLLDNGFAAHHASQSRGFMFARPLDAKRCKVPAYGTHYARVECVVVEQETGHVLVIRECLGSSSSTKFVTGCVDAGEYVGRAAEREVFEETSVKARFVGLLGFGQRLRTRFGKDELLLGCQLEAAKGQTPRADGDEVSHAVWMPPHAAASTCNPMAREWLFILARNPTPMLRSVMPDMRGHGHTMELHAQISGFNSK